MNQVISDLRAVPLRFLLLASIGAVVVLLVAGLVDWEPWRANNTVLAEGWGGGVGALTLLVWTSAPLLSLRSPLLAGFLALSPLLVVTAADAERSWPITQFVSLVLCAMVAAWRSRALAVCVGGLAMVPVLGYAFAGTSLRLPYGTTLDMQPTADRWFEVSIWVIAVAVAVVVAAMMAASCRDGRRAAELEGRAHEVEQRSAVVGERARLARDLHDVVAHHVSLIAVRAETAPYTVPDLPAAGRTLLAEIADDSRRALDELRGVLGILGRSSEDPSLAPQPGAADISVLVDAARAAGEQVEWQVADLSSVRSTAGYAAYRVVQEALTNARRHAPGAPVVVRTSPDWLGGVTVTVANAAATPDLQAGRGLVGMRERVESLGGSLEVDHADGSVRVEARIPGEVS